MYIDIAFAVIMLSITGYVVYTRHLIERDNFILIGCTLLLIACLSVTPLLRDLKPDASYQLDRAAKTVNATDISTIKDNGKQGHVAILTSGQVIKLDKVLDQKGGSGNIYPNQPLRYVIKAQNKTSAWNPLKRVPTNKRMVWVYVRP